MGRENAEKKHHITTTPAKNNVNFIPRRNSHNQPNKSHINSKTNDYSSFLNTLMKTNSYYVTYNNQKDQIKSQYLNVKKLHTKYQNWGP